MDRREMEDLDRVCSKLWVKYELFKWVKLQTFTQSKFIEKVIFLNIPYIRDHHIYYYKWEASKVKSQLDYHFTSTLNQTFNYLNNKEEFFNKIRRNTRSRVS